MLNARVSAAAFGLPAGPLSDADLRGTRHINRDGSYDRRAIFATARSLMARWATDPKAERFYGVGRERWSCALRRAWEKAQEDRSLVRVRADLTAEQYRLAALSEGERELASVEKQIYGLWLVDGDFNRASRETGVLMARARELRASLNLPLAA